MLSTAQFAEGSGDIAVIGGGRSQALCRRRIQQHRRDAYRRDRGAVVRLGVGLDYSAAPAISVRDMIMANSEWTRAERFMTRNALSAEAARLVYSGTDDKRVRQMSGG